MSKNPHAEIGQLLIDIRAADAAVAKAEKALAALEMKAGQETAGISVGGHYFALTALDRTYSPAPVPGMQAMRAEAIKAMRNHMISLRGAAEGKRWRLQQLSRSA